VQDLKRKGEKRRGGREMSESLIKRLEDLKRRYPDKKGLVEGYEESIRWMEISANKCDYSLLFLEIAHSSEDFKRILDAIELHESMLLLDARSSFFDELAGILRDKCRCIYVPEEE
jgi:hypothetical protein